MHLHSRLVSKTAKLALGLVAATCLLDPGKALSAAPLDSKLSLRERSNQQRETLVMLEMLQGLNFSEKRLNELNVSEFVERYLTTLDPNHSLFTVSDVEFLKRRFDPSLRSAYLFKGDLRPAFEIFDLLLTRARGRISWVEQTLEGKMDFSQPGEFSLERKDSPWPANQNEAELLWLKLLKVQVLDEEWKGATESEAKAIVRERFVDYRKQLERTSPLVVRETFLNVLMGFFDPHSGYFSRDSADAFDQHMSGKLVGIGVGLQLEKGRFLVRSLRQGGPADLSGQVYVEDELLAVSKADGSLQTTKGRRFRDIAALLMGESGTTVRVQLVSEGYKEIRTVELKRSEIALEESRARGFLCTYTWENTQLKIGILDLPAFYGKEEVSGSSGTSVSTDVEALLKDLMSKGVQGIIIDLRNNGGGLLHEANRLVKLFSECDKAFYMKGLDGKLVASPEISVTPYQYMGPLVVLCSSGSASASELFAGAMKASHRAVVVGEDSTFGKGTAQHYMDLKRTGPEAQEAKDWGVLRVTRDRFYLPDGKSPQLDGITSDVVMPSLPWRERERERDLPGAIASDSFPISKSFRRIQERGLVSPLLLERLSERSKQRQVSSPDFRLLKQFIEVFEPLVGRVAVPVSREDHLAKRGMAEKQWIQLYRERLALYQKNGYQVEAVDLSSVTRQKQEHQAQLRGKKLPDGSPWLGHLFGSWYLYAESPESQVFEVHVASVAYELCFGHEAALVAAWKEASGTEISVETLRILITDICRQRLSREHKLKLRELFRKRLPKELPQEALEKGLQAFLRKAVELDDEVARDRPKLDIHMRESLRVLGDWLVEASSGKFSRGK